MRTFHSQETELPFICAFASFQGSFSLNIRTYVVINSTGIVDETGDAWDTFIMLEELEWYATAGYGFGATVTFCVAAVYLGFIFHVPSALLYVLFILRIFVVLVRIWI